MFRFRDGSPLYRSEVPGLIQVAAEETGVDKSRYAVHSLRIGGACLLLHAGFSIEIIQRWGRWASNAFQCYLWESSEDSRGVAAKMVASRGALTVTRQLGVRGLRPQISNGLNPLCPRVSLWGGVNVT